MEHRSPLGSVTVCSIMYFDHNVLKSNRAGCKETGLQNHRAKHEIHLIAFGQNKACSRTINTEVEVLCRPVK